MDENLAVLVAMYIAPSQEKGDMERRSLDMEVPFCTHGKAKHCWQGGGNEVKPHKNTAGQLFQTELIIPEFPPKGAAEPLWSEQKVFNNTATKSIRWKSRNRPDPHWMCLESQL